MRLTTPRFFFHRCLMHLKAPPSEAQLFAQQVTVAVERNDLDLAAQKIRDALQTGLPVPPSVMSCVLHALDKEGHTQEALHLSRDVRQAAMARSAVDPISAWPVGTLCQLLKLHCAVGDISSARSLIHTLEDVKSDLPNRAVSAFLSLCASNDSASDAEWICQRAAIRNVRLRAEDYANLLWIYRCDLTKLNQTFAHGLAELPGPLTPDVATKVAAAFGESSHALDFQPSEVDVANGKCSRCGGTLQPHYITAPTKTRLLDDIRTKLAPQPTKDGRGAQAFDTFRRFIEPATQYDVIVDGANVGFYGLSNWANTQARKPGQGLAIDYRLVETVMAMVRRHGLRPLVLLHQRHMEPSHLRTSEAKRIAEQWTRAREVYITPPKVNDDILWLYASVYHSVTPHAAGGTGEVGGAGVGPSAPKAAGKGKPMMVVTNDKMRDHHFALLSPEDFYLWRQHHQIGFRCERDHEDKVTHVVLQPPMPYGVRAHWALGGGAGLHLPLGRATDPTKVESWWCGQRTGD